MGHLLIQSDARRQPIRSGSVQVCVTSPPYWSLRDYGVSGQIGLESSVDEYVATMVSVFREVWRILRDDGTLWLNLGDSMSSGGRTSWGRDDKLPERGREGRPPSPPGIGPKNLLLIPERVALALQADGWTVRAKPCWYKVNCMPESVTDRPTTAHESIFLLTKRERYFYDADAVRSAHAPKSLTHRGGGKAAGKKGQQDASGKVASGNFGEWERPRVIDPAGRNRRTSDWFVESLDEAIAYHESEAAHLRRVRDRGGMLSADDGTPLALKVASEPWRGAHFATFPSKLIRPMVLASTSEAGACPACGAGWVRETERGGQPNGTHVVGGYGLLEADGSHRGQNTRRGMAGSSFSNNKADRPVRVVSSNWRPACRCDAGPPVPCVVADVFTGSGTTGLVATGLGRRFVGLDLNREYLAMADRRISRPHAAVPRPSRDAGALPLFD